MAKKDSKLEKKSTEYILQNDQTVSKVIQGLPKDKREEVTQLIVGIAESHVFRGPLPAPEMFREYEKVLPGLSREIVDMAKDQQSHRMELEKKYVSSSILQSSRGQVMGFILGILCIIGAVVSAYIHESTLACILGGTTLLGVVVVFVLNRLPWKSGNTEDTEE